LPSNQAAQWGLAALLIGGFLMLFAPLVLLINIALAYAKPRNLQMGRSDISLATVGFLIAGLLVLFLGIMGLACATISLMNARARRESIALGLAGLLICAVALVLYIAVGIDTAAVLAWFNRNPDG
jgi:hypothetical protein